MLHAILDQRMQGLGLERSSVRFEGACIEVDYSGVEAAPCVYLVGDAAGLASPLTAEGIYPALVSGEEVARRILEPGHPMPRLHSWLRIKRRHHRLATLLAPLPLRRLFLALLSAAGASRLTRGAVADLFISA